MANSKIVSTIALSSLTAAMLTFSGCGSTDDATPPAAGSTPCLVGTTLSGDCTSDVTLTAGTQWKIDGLVKIKNGATLTVEAGTTVYGAEGANYIVVTKGSKIMAEGTAVAPIIFTSEIAKDDQALGDVAQWGGLTILGNAPTNHTDAFYEVDETDADFAFGGTDEADNSGVLTHVKILNSGKQIVTDLEINGLSLAGVGSGTTISDINVTNSSDDCVEIWGGTVNVSNIDMTNCQDDSFDLDYGYVGTATNISVNVTEVGSHAGFEISSGGDTPMTSPVIDGFTITKVDGSDEGGIYIKDDTTAPQLLNGTVTTAGVDTTFKTKLAFTPAQDAALTMTNVVASPSVTASGAGETDILAIYNNQ